MKKHFKTYRWEYMALLVFALVFLILTRVIQRTVNEQQENRIQEVIRNTEYVSGRYYMKNEGTWVPIREPKIVLE